MREGARQQGSCMCKPRVFDAHIVKALGGIFVNHARGPALFSIPVMPHKLQVLLGQLVRCSPLRPRHSARNRAHSHPSPTPNKNRRLNPLTSPLHPPSPPPPRTRVAAAAAATSRLQDMTTHDCRESASSCRRHAAWALGVATTAVAVQFTTLFRPQIKSSQKCIDTDTETFLY